MTQQRNADIDPAVCTGHTSAETRQVRILGYGDALDERMREIVEGRVRFRCGEQQRQVLREEGAEREGSPCRK